MLNKRNLCIWLIVSLVSLIIGFFIYNDHGGLLLFAFFIGATVEIVFKTRGSKIEIKKLKEYFKPKNIVNHILQSYSLANWSLTIILMMYAGGSLQNALS